MGRGGGGACRPGGRRGGRDGEAHPMDEIMRRTLTSWGGGTRGGGSDAADTQEDGMIERREIRDARKGWKATSPWGVIGVDCRRAKVVEAWPRVVMVG